MCVVGAALDLSNGAVLRTMQVLLAAGARASVKDLDGETALMWAKNYTDNDASGKCVTILEAACVNMMTHP